MAEIPFSSSDKVNYAFMAGSPICRIQELKI